LKDAAEKSIAKWKFIKSWIWSRKIQRIRCIWYSWRNLRSIIEIVLPQSGEQFGRGTE
jgi:hypothetical protein